jgi:hypothetical protein
MRRENGTYLLCYDDAGSDAQRRRERHIALLDSIVEEEEEVPLNNPVVRILQYLWHLSPINFWFLVRSSPKVTTRSEFAARMTQSTLPSIPEHDDGDADVPDSTVRESLPAQHKKILIDYFRHPSAWPCRKTGHRLGVPHWWSPRRGVGSWLSMTLKISISTLLRYRLVTIVRQLSLVSALVCILFYFNIPFILLFSFLHADLDLD